MLNIVFSCSTLLQFDVVCILWCKKWTRLKTDISINRFFKPWNTCNRHVYYNGNDLTVVTHTPFIFYCLY